VNYRQDCKADLDFRKDRIGAMATIYVVLADDHPQIRAGLKKIIKREKDLEVSGEAADGCQAMQMVTELRPDVLLIDVEMPGMNGIQVTQQMQEHGIWTPVIVVSAYEDLEYILALFSLGISGYLVKEEAPDNLGNAIRAVSDHKHKWVSHRMVAAVNAMLTNGYHSNSRRLTEYETCLLKSLQKDFLDNGIDGRPFQENRWRPQVL
jgi:DNA-binding NarL/FixJ family response regulator